ncbi:MAG TPA: ATP-binding protein, partial [Bacteroidales bacterium]|nr:ATP-binding protein [Bacteroidales bacterium]
INDIVSMSGIEAGQESVSLLDFDLESDLASLKRKILEDYPAAATRFEMELNIPFKPFKIRTDKAKLNEIIIKLIDNAFKFAESGPVKLKIEFKNDSLFGEIHDAGIGIEPGDCHVIFEPFRKLENDARKLYRGNGLGLCLSKAYVELLNGKITVNSQPGEGSVFSFNFPVEVLNEPAKVSIPVVIGQIEPNHPTFLLVEDEHSNMELLRSALKGIKANIVLAYNGLEAVKFFENGQHADIVLMDIKMPVLNGYETVKQLKGKQLNTIFIAVTAYALTGDEAVAIGSGFDDYLPKPFSREKLIEVLTKFIRLESNID